MCMINTHIRTSEYGILYVYPAEVVGATHVVGDVIITLYMCVHVR